MQLISNNTHNPGISVLKDISSRREDPASPITSNSYGSFIFIPTVATDEAVSQMPATARARLYSITGDLLARGAFLARTDSLAYDSFLAKLGLDPSALPAEKVKRLSTGEAIGSGLGLALGTYLSPYTSALSMIMSMGKGGQADENTEAQAAYEERLQAEATYGAVGGKKAKKYQKAKALARLTSPPPPKAAQAAADPSGIAELLEELLYSEEEEPAYFDPSFYPNYPSGQMYQPQPQFYPPPQPAVQPQYVYQQPQQFATPTVGPEALMPQYQYPQSQAPDPFAQWGLPGKKGKKGRSDSLILVPADESSAPAAFSGQYHRYMADAGVAGWPTPAELINDLFDNTRPKAGCGCAHDCAICNDSAGEFFQRDNPEAGPVGEFFRSSWINASLVPMMPGQFGEVNVSTLPYKVKINSEAVNPRQELSLVHEGLHAASQTLKLPIDHQELHSLAAMILSEVIPSVSALRAYRGK
jgi:hypothetical protein